MKRITIYIFFILSVLSCQEKPETPIDAQEPVLTTVSINIGTADESAKANFPLIPDVENLIHDVWVIQFSERGVLYTGVDRFYRTSGEDGARFLTLEAQVMSGKSTICLMANLKKVNFNVTALQAGLPDNLPQFKSTLLDMTSLLNSINTDNSPSAIPMFGYWEGTIGTGSPTLGGNNLNVTLGRMLCRVNLTIANRSAATLKQLTFTNASRQVYYFPQISSAALPASAYCTYNYGLNLPTGTAATIYFYWAPNFCYGEEKATKMTFTDESGKSYSCYVTNSSTSEENCDYNMYHNCNYTITVAIQ
ncbi:MAG: DUF4906 domain-containing protein [Bacteroidales bacterium]|nr:DUF4906 domain-containing protein [Bacteroidales bacterium]